MWCVLVLVIFHPAYAAAAQEDFLPPLMEPSVSDYYGLSPQGGLQPVERIRAVRPEDFDERIRGGRPFIVEDAGEGNPFVGATCESFHQRFPKAQMRAEYTGGGREKFVSLGSQDWLHKDRLAGTQAEHSTGGSVKLNAPYVWHVKDGGHEAPPEVRAAVQREWRPPYFVQGATNLREANESVEFWFSRRGGAVTAHADTYCIPAVSLQLQGTKTWRLMPPPPITSVVNRYDSHDGGLYGTGLWQPVYEATVKEGEAIVFFPNLFHETYLPMEGPECTVAATFQIQLPVPVRYLRAYLPTHAMSHLYYEGHCRQLWESYATLRAPGEVRPTCDEGKLATLASGLFEAADADADGRLTARELEAHLAEANPPWPRWFLTDDYFYDYKPGPTEREDMSAELLRNRARDTLAYHDLDADGAVSESEVLAALRQWGVTHTRVRKLERLRDKGASEASMRKAEQDFDKRYARGPVGRRTTAGVAGTREHEGEEPSPRSSEL